MSMPTRAFIQRHDEWVIEGCYEALVEAAACATRVAASLLDGTERRLLHGRCMPTAPGELDGVDAQAAQWKPAGFASGPTPSSGRASSSTTPASTPASRKGLTTPLPAAASTC
jgi:hypothetical protein